MRKYLCYRLKKGQIKTVIAAVTDTLPTNALYPAVISGDDKRDAKSKYLSGLK